MAHYERGFSQGELDDTPLDPELEGLTDGLTWRVSVQLSDQGLHKVYERQIPVDFPEDENHWRLVKQRFNSSERELDGELSQIFGGEAVGENVFHGEHGATVRIVRPDHRPFLSRGDMMRIFEAEMFLTEAGYLKEEPAPDVPAAVS